MDAADRTASDLVKLAAQLLAGAAALVGWVAVVGGVRVWSRLDALGLPQATSTVAALPREALIAEGLRLLTAPIAIAGVTAAALYALIACLPALSFGPLGEWPERTWNGWGWFVDSDPPVRVIAAIAAVTLAGAVAVAALGGSSALVA